jgi:hypothetical protein
MKIFAYRNLHYRNQVMWSLRDCKTGLVAFRKPKVYLSKVEFKVSQAGRERVLRERRKNVHAGVQGTLLINPPKGVTWLKARYNPYETSTFVTVDGESLLRAKYAKLDEQGLWYATSL